METLRALDGQQVKWNYGAIDLMWPGQRSNPGPAAAPQPAAALE